MSVCSSEYKTSKFTLRDQQSVDHIRRLVMLLRDESNLYCGYYFKDHYIDMYGNDLTFFINTGGYADGGPTIKHNAINCNDYQQSDDRYVNLFDEIHSRLKQGTYFTVYSYDRSKHDMLFGVTVYQANGPRLYDNSVGIEARLLKQLQQPA